MKIESKAKRERERERYLRTPSSWLTGMESEMETEALELELAFEDEDSSFSSALFNLIFWVWFNDSSISLIFLSSRSLSLFLCKTLNPSPRVCF